MKANERTWARTYRFGEGHPTLPDGRKAYAVPYTVHYTPESRYGDFYLGEGDTRNGNGTFLRAADLLKPQWRRHLEIAGVVWLIPWLEKIASGNAVLPDELLEAYHAATGEPAPVEHWPATGH
jgi:hypothetical protein